MKTFNVINQSKKISDSDLELIIEACKVQLKEHAAPSLNRYPWDIKVGGDDGYPLVILDDPDHATALGYHTQDPCGKVWGRVFVNPILNNGGTLYSSTRSVSVVLSHEILETFYNPYVNLWSNRSDETFVALEICDPVENSSYEIEINQIKIHVSNFVLDCWFDKEMSNAGKFDYLSTINSPLTLGKGGYNVIFNSETGEVKSIFACKEDEYSHGIIKPSHPASRTNRNLCKKSLIIG